MQIFEATCTKCATTFEIEGMPGVMASLCPECRKKGYNLVGILEWKAKPSAEAETLRERIASLEAENGRLKAEAEHMLSTITHYRDSKRRHAPNSYEMQLASERLADAERFARTALQKEGE